MYQAFRIQGQLIPICYQQTIKNELQNILFTIFTSNHKLENLLRNVHNLYIENY